jgi:hypothetical protein
MQEKPKSKKQQRADKKRRDKRLESVFAVLLVIIPEALHMPIIPWGFVLWICAWLIGMHLLATAECFEQWTKGQKVVCVLILTIVAWEVSETSLYRKWREEKAAALEGDLFLASSNATRKVIEFGAGGMRAEADANGRALSFYADANLDVRNDDGHLLLSTVVRDQQGKVVVKIENNHWSVSPDKGICLDKNYSDDALEVKDGRDHIVLQMRLYPDRIQLQGEWFNDKGEPVMVAVNPKTKGTVIFVKGLKYDPNVEAIVIRPLFQYPSATHWAEWVKQP